LKSRLLGDEYPDPIFARKRNKYSSKTGKLIEERLVPFQAVDFLAYLVNLDAKCADHDWRDKKPLREIFVSISKIPEATVQPTPELLSELNVYLRAFSAFLSPASDNHGASI